MDVRSGRCARWGSLEEYLAMEDASEEKHILWEAEVCSVDALYATPPDEA